jgi:preprotein translocase subunit SecE
VARDRKRAKQRRERRGVRASRLPRPSQPERSDVPGALDHASADADEFEAALVRGAGGVASEPDDAELEEEEELAEAESAPQEELAEAEVAPQEQLAVQEMRADGAADGGVARVQRERLAEAAPREAPPREGNRAIAFLQASWAELQRVQWPDRRQVTQATAVVLGFVAIAGAYLGLADFVAKEIVEFIL